MRLSLSIKQIEDFKIPVCSFELQEKLSKVYKETLKEKKILEKLIVKKEDFINGVVLKTLKDRGAFDER